MPAYRYTVRDSAGITREGVSEAEAEAILRQRLQEQGFSVQRIAQTQIRQVTSDRKVSDTTSLQFWMQVSTMLDAEVPVLRALEIASEQSLSRSLREIVSRVRAEMQAGASLSKAMKRYPRCFRSDTLGMIRAGEEGSCLNEAVRRLVAFLNEEHHHDKTRRSLWRFAFVSIVLAVFVCKYLLR